MALVLPVTHPAVQAGEQRVGPGEAPIPLHLNSIGDFTRRKNKNVKSVII